MISHKYSCIFVHVPKTGGQSIEHLFLKDAGLTWETRAPLLLKLNKDPKRGPPRLAHLTAQEYVKYRYVTQKEFDGYFKFAFVRNPWARTVSMYKYLPNYISFEDFVFGNITLGQSGKDRWFLRPQAEYIEGAEGATLVDRVARFENFTIEMTAIQGRLGLAGAVPHENRSTVREASSLRKARLLARALLAADLKRAGAMVLRGDFGRKEKHPRYTDYYTKETRDQIAKVYARDVAAFGYDFDDA